MLLVYYFIIPGFIFSAAIGLLSTWFDRKLTARLQYRKGPPWFQPFADIAKLMGKEVIVPQGAEKAIFLSAPILGLTAATLVSTMLWLFNLDARQSYLGDLIVILYLLMIPSVAVMVGGAASRNPLASVGVSREMKLVLAYELPFIIAVFSVVYKVKSIIFADIISYQAANGVLGASLSGILAFVVCLLVVQAKLGYVPFDMPEAEQEIICGAATEYSGAPLAFFRITKAILFFALPVLLVTLFWGGISIFPIINILWFILKYLAVLLLIVLIKNTNPRVKIDQAVAFFWGPVTIIAFFAFIFAMLGW